MNVDDELDDVLDGIVKLQKVNNNKVKQLRNFVDSRINEVIDHHIIHREGESNRNKRRKAYFYYAYDILLPRQGDIELMIKTLEKTLDDLSAFNVDKIQFEKMLNSYKKQDRIIEPVIEYTIRKGENL